MNYTYRFAELLSDIDIAELELSNVKFDKRIIVPGSFSADLIIVNPDVASIARKIVPAKTVVHVSRGTEIWNTYIIWQVKVKSNSRGAPTLSLSGASLESYFHRRIVDVDRTHSSVDQIDILRTLVGDAQVGWSENSVSYAQSANLGITVKSGSSGVPRDRTYRISEAISAGQRMEELANVDNGFEYAINTHVDTVSNTRPRVLEWGYPRINAGVKELEFFYPGNISEYEILYDATDAGTAWWTRGETPAGDGTTDQEPIMSGPRLATGLLDQRFPHLDRVVDYPSVSLTSTLDEYAKWWRDNHSGFVVIPQVDVDVSEMGSFFSHQVGSYVRFTIIDDFFPLNQNGPSFSGEFRVIGAEVTPGERGNNEKIRFVIETDIDPTDRGG